MAALRIDSRASFENSCDFLLQMQNEVWVEKPVLSETQMLAPGCFPEAVKHPVAKFPERILKLNRPISGGVGLAGLLWEQDECLWRDIVNTRGVPK